MVSVDLIAMVTSEASDGHERSELWLRAKVTSEASYGYERSELWSCSMTLLWRKVLECSSSPCSLRHPCDLTLMEEGSGVFFLTAHFVIPVISLLWRKVLECSSSHCSLRHPCVLTHFVIPVFSLTSSSLCPHSLRHPCVLTPMTCLLTHLIVIPDFSLESSHPSHP